MIFQIIDLKVRKFLHVIEHYSDYDYQRNHIMFINLLSSIFIWFETFVFKIVYWIYIRDDTIRFHFFWLEFFPWNMFTSQVITSQNLNFTDFIIKITLLFSYSSNNNTMSIIMIQKYSFYFWLVLFFYTNNIHTCHKKQGLWYKHITKSHFTLSKNSFNS